MLKPTGGIQATEKGMRNRMMYPHQDESIVPEKDLAYWKANAEEDYTHVPISVLKYISELEESKEQPSKVKLLNTWNGETETYQELQYTQVDGIYGYLCVDINFVVLFFYSDDEGMQVYELTHYQVINKPEQL